VVFIIFFSINLLIDTFNVSANYSKKPALNKGLSMKVMMITGAGISVGSGIDTYRGKEGRYTALEKELGMGMEQLLNPTMLAEQPELVWKYWLEFALAVTGKEPAPAHHAIKAIADQCDEFLEVTQNVDGLSVRAGLTSDQLIELHGAARNYHCTACGQAHGLSITPELSIPPRCYRCDPENGAVIRPDIVMFNENIKPEHFERAEKFASEADLLIMTGTSMQFPYLGYFLRIAANAGAILVYLDPEAKLNASMFGHSSNLVPLNERIFYIRRSADEVLPLMASDMIGYLNEMIEI
jgi:NAD-dependent deacetylase